MGISVLIFAASLGSLALVFLLAFLVLVCVVTKKIWNIHKRLRYIENWKNIVEDKDGSTMLRDKSFPGEEVQAPLIDNPHGEMVMENMNRSLETITEDTGAAVPTQSGGSTVYANVMLTKGSNTSRSNVTSSNSIPYLPSMRNCGSASSTGNIIQDLDKEADYINVGFGKRKASSYNAIDTASNISYHTVHL